MKEGRGSLCFECDSLWNFIHTNIYNTMRMQENCQSWIVNFKAPKFSVHSRLSYDLYIWSVTIGLLDKIRVQDVDSLQIVSDKTSEFTGVCEVRQELIGKEFGYEFSLAPCPCLSFYFLLIFLLDDYIYYQNIFETETFNVYLWKDVYLSF